MTIDISGITVDGPHFGSNRSTKYEARFIHIGANEVGIEAVERGVAGVTPVRCILHEDDYTEAQITTIQTAFSLLEEGFRLRYDAKEEELLLAGIDVPRAVVHDLVQQAEAAKTEKATTDAEIAAAQAQLAALNAQIAAAQAEIGGLSPPVIVPGG
jgi:hypothetical protein